MTQYDENVRYKATLDLSASEVDELFHAIMHHKERLVQLQPVALRDNQAALNVRINDARRLLLTLRKELKRYVK